MLIAFCLVQWLGLTENSLAPPLFLPITYTYKWEKNQHLSILFSWLNNAVSFILSSYVRCSKPLVIFMALCWACLSSIFYQGAQHLTEDCRYVSSALGREKGSLLLTFWLRSASVQVRMLLSFFATYCITASLFFFWQAVFQHGLAAEIIPLLEQVFLFPSVELHEVAAIPFPYPVEFPLNGSATIRRYQTFLPVLYQWHTYWGYSLSHHPGWWWRH